MVRVSVTGKVTSNVKGTGVMLPSEAVEVASGVSSGVDAVSVGSGRLAVAEGIVVGVDVASVCGASVKVAAGRVGSVASSIVWAFEGSISQKTVRMETTNTPKVKAYLAPESGRKRRIANVSRPKMLDQARCTSETRAPCGQRSPMPFPTPNPLALSGMNSP